MFTVPEVTLYFDTLRSQFPMQVLPLACVLDRQGVIGKVSTHDECLKRLKSHAYCSLHPYRDGQQLCRSTPTSLSSISPSSTSSSAQIGLSREEILISHALFSEQVASSLCSYLTFTLHTSKYNQTMRAIQREEMFNQIMNNTYHQYWKHVNEKNVSVSGFNLLDMSSYVVTYLNHSNYTNYSNTIFKDERPRKVYQAKSNTQALQTTSTTGTSARIIETRSDVSKEGDGSFSNSNIPSRLVLFNGGVNTSQLVFYGVFHVILCFLCTRWILNRCSHRSRTNKTLRRPTLYV